MSSLLIRNGTVVTATDRYQADVYIEGETDLHDRCAAGCFG